MQRGLDAMLHPCYKNWLTLQFIEPCRSAGWSRDDLQEFLKVYTEAATSLEVLTRSVLKQNHRVVSVLVFWSVELENVFSRNEETKRIAFLLQGATGLRSRLAFLSSWYLFGNTVSLLCLQEHDTGSSLGPVHGHDRKLPGADVPHIIPKPCYQNQNCQTTCLASEWMDPILKQLVKDNDHLAPSVLTLERYALSEAMVGELLDALTYRASEWLREASLECCHCCPPPAACPTTTYFYGCTERPSHLISCALSKHTRLILWLRGLVFVCQLNTSSHFLWAIVLTNDCGVAAMCTMFPLFSVHARL